MSTSIQMVGAGFAHTVAPLGTALTERQLADPLADGRRADPLLRRRQGRAFAPPTAPPTWPCRSSRPGKSLRFALLPEGQDPDDLIRAAGRDAMAAVIAAARPLVDLLWSRETAAGVFDTPERRAALEARLRDIARGIDDESVRRHYVQAFAERVAAFFPRARAAASAQWRAARRGRGRAGAAAPSPPRPPPRRRSRSPTA